MERQLCDAAEPFVMEAVCGDADGSSDSRHLSCKESAKLVPRASEKGLRSLWLLGELAK